MSTSGHEVVGVRLQGLVCLVADETAVRGRKLAAALRQEGALVLLVTPLAVMSSDSHPIVEMTADLRSDQGWQSIVRRVTSEYGRLDVLVNASDAPDGSSAGTITAAHLAEISSAIIETAALGTKHCIDLIRRSSARGALITIAPAEGLTGLPSDLGWTVAGGAIDALVRSAAIHCHEKGYAVRCNCILVSRYARAPEIAAAAIYLASAESPYFTGHSIVLDDGLAGCPDERLQRPLPV